MGGMRWLSAHVLNGLRTCYPLNVEKARSSNVHAGGVGACMDVGEATATRRKELALTPTFAARTCPSSCDVAQFMSRKSVIATVHIARAIVMCNHSE